MLAHERRYRLEPNLANLWRRSSVKSNRCLPGTGWDSQTLDQVSPQTKGVETARVPRRLGWLKRALQIQSHRELFAGKRHRSSPFMGDCGRARISAGGVVRDDPPPGDEPDTPTGSVLGAAERMTGGGLRNRDGARGSWRPSIGYDALSKDGKWPNNL